MICKVFLFLLLPLVHSYVLNLAPAALFPQQGYYNTTLSSWGGSVIVDDNGLFHMFAAAMTEECGLDQWTTNSEVIHATSSSPTGPFAMRDVALPVWHHNPQVIRDISGLYLLFSIGMDPEGTPVNCTHSTEVWTTHGAELIELYYSSSLSGPWTPLMVNGSINLFNGTNPSPFILSNGSIAVGSHSGNGFDVALADSWKGPYTLHKSVFIWENGTTGEDPFLWFDEGLQKWRVLFHQYNTSDPHDGSLWVGGYAESETSNILGKWNVQDYRTPAYRLNLTFV